MTSLMCLLFLLLLLIFPAHSTSCARNALAVWGLDVVPSLFPYMVLCRLLSESLRKYSIPSFLSISLLGLLGGSPSGASVISSYADTLRRRQILALYALTGTVSPMFLISTVGKGWMGSMKAGYLLAFSQTTGAALCFLFMSAVPDINHERAETQPIRTVSSDPVHESILAIFSVGGYIVLFSVLSGITAFLPRPLHATHPFIHAMLEVAGGMHSLCVSSLAPRAKACLLSAFSGFGGFSILFQNLFFLKPLDIRVISLLPIAFFRALCCSLVMWMLYPLINA